MASHPLRVPCLACRAHAPQPLQGVRLLRTDLSERDLTAWRREQLADTLAHLIPVGVGEGGAAKYEPGAPLRCPEDLLGGLEHAAACQWSCLIPHFICALAPVPRFEPLCVHGCARAHGRAHATPAGSAGATWRMCCATACSGLRRGG